MFWILTNYSYHTFSSDDRAFITDFFYRRSNFHSYFFRNTIRPLVRSYGVRWTRTESQTIKLIKCFLIFPDMYAWMTFPPNSSGSLTSKTAPGRVFTMTPSTSILSSFGILDAENTGLDIQLKPAHCMQKVLVRKSFFKNH